MQIVQDLRKNLGELWELAVAGSREQISVRVHLLVLFRSVLADPDRNARMSWMTGHTSLTRAQTTLAACASPAASLIATRSPGRPLLSTASATWAGVSVSTSSPGVIPVLAMS